MLGKTGLVFLFVGGLIVFGLLDVRSVGAIRGRGLRGAYLEKGLEQTDSRCFYLRRLLVR